MVELDIDDATQTGQIVLRPNASGTWRFNLYLLYTLMIVSGTVSIGFLFAGAWMILPFSIIEMGALAGCMFYCNRQCNRQEVITVSDDLVSIEQGVRQPNRAITYQRLWAKYLVSPPPHPWGVSRIAIRSHNQESELGGFLSQADKQQLVKALKRVTPR